MQTSSDDASNDRAETSPSDPAPPAPDPARRPPSPEPKDDLYNPCGRVDRVIIQGHEVSYPIFCAPPPSYVGDPPPVLPASASEIDSVAPEDGAGQRVPGPCSGPEPC